MKTKKLVSLPDQAERFYRDVLLLLNRAGIDYLVGGSLALAHYMHLSRRPKDLDIFLPRSQCDLVLEILEGSGYRTEQLHPHWLAKAYDEHDLFVDFIFNSGNGVVPVDDSWFVGAPKAKLFGVPVRLCTPEDIVWSKSFIMDRERFDGADIAHLIRDVGEKFDWQRALDRFRDHWRVLLSHLLLFQYIFPQSNAVPKAVLSGLLDRVCLELAAGPSTDILCKGTLLSRDQYLHDVEELGYSDARLVPSGLLVEDEVSRYTEAIRADQAAREARKLVQARDVMPPPPVAQAIENAAPNSGKNAGEISDKGSGKDEVDAA